MKNHWIYNSNNYKLEEVSQQVELLPVGVYKTKLDQYEQMFLARIDDKFPLPAKIYDVERPFIDRVKTSWTHTTGNMGVLLNGIKGTGKSICAEMIANEMNLPVIIVSFQHKSLISFLNDIQQDVVVFIDEYDKIFERYSNALLPIMDGVLKSDHRIMFLLTSNEVNLERNMMQRPSRIRYIKTFGDMTLPVIMEVVNDILIHKELYDDTVKFISELPIITMDLVKSIVSEVNIHHESPRAFEDVFNINDSNSIKSNVYKIENGKQITMHENVYVSPEGPYSGYEIGRELECGNDYEGTIVEILGPNEIIVRSYEDKGDPLSTDRKEIFERLIITKSVKTHRAFAAANAF